jgi:hypothetical protein
MNNTILDKETPDTASFEEAFKFLMLLEDSHPSGLVTIDAGGKTKYGISQNSYPSLDISSLTFTNAKLIYYQDFWKYSAWDIALLHTREQRIANKFLQIAVNLGVGTALHFGIIADFLLTSSTAEFNYKPGQQLNLIKGVPGSLYYKELFDILCGMQISRYMKDYHMLSRVPHGLVTRSFI